MISKRIIGVITVKNNIAVQSFGYRKYLPIGDPKILVKNLNRWGVDEILINVIDRWTKNKEPDFQLVSKIKDLNITTPIIYGGAINNLENAKKLIRNGVDRLLVEKIIINDFDEFNKIYNEIGSQSLILSLPLKKKEKSKYIFFNSISKKEEKINEKFIICIKEKLISEILLIDYENEGSNDGFDLKLLNFFKKLKVDLICFGGIKSSNFIKKITKNKNVSAVGIGNSLNYLENSVQILKKKLQKNKFRKPNYVSSYDQY